jgi:hypothetical protein
MPGTVVGLRRIPMVLRVDHPCTLRSDAVGLVSRSADSCAKSFELGDY